MSESSAFQGGEEAFRGHMRRAGALVAERRLPEAEAEIVQALEIVPADLRALKLLALVRFRLGRFAEARETYRAVARAAPDDPTARLNLGLIALKLEWYAEAAEELEAAVRLRPDDQRAFGYLGYAYARLGRTTDAANALRRAGQHELVAELHSRARGAFEPLTPTQAAVVPSGAAAAREEAYSQGFGRTPTGATRLEVPAPLPADGVQVGTAPVSEPARAGASLSLTSFTIGRLLSPDDVPGSSEWLADGIYRFPVNDEAHVNLEALLAAEGQVVLERARRRQRGRLGQGLLGLRQPGFYRCQGAGEVWLSSPQRRGTLLALTLEDDTLYLLEDRVMAFGGELVWEWGRVPRSPLALLQFRGSGRVLVDWGDAEVIGFRMAEPKRLTIPQHRVFGWIGRVVVQGVTSPEGEPSPQVACEGEGVLLITRHEQTIHPASVAASGPEALPAK
jgi:tetratricopeptide (TPR) repeat protein